MRKLTLDDMNIMAQKRGGKCMSSEYDGLFTKLLWQCDKGHEWEAIPSNLMNGRTWCPYCSQKRLWSPGMPEPKARMNEMQFIAQERGGDCLSTHYLNATAKLQWRCKDGHEWEAAPSNIKLGSWCPYCSGRKLWSPGKSEAETRLDGMRFAAQQRGGECLSLEYLNSVTKLRWRCKDGHEWEARPRDILQGHWCPKCRNKKLTKSAIEINIDKLKICKKVRVNRKNMTIIQQENEDIITNPLHPNNLAAPFTAALSQVKDQSVLLFHDLKIEIHSLKCFKNGQKVDLSPKEFALLVVLCANAGNGLSRSRLSSRIWGDDCHCGKCLDIYIMRLRNKLEDNPAEPSMIHTMRGYGFMCD